MRTKRFFFILVVGVFLLGLGVSCQKAEEPKSEVPLNPQRLAKAATPAPNTKEEEKKAVKKKGDKSSAAPVKEMVDGKIEPLDPAAHEAKDKDPKNPKFDIIVPDEVKKTWHAIKLSIEDKKASKKDTPVIPLGSVYELPGTDIKIKTGEFLPDFKMDALTITSPTNEPRNPAVNVKIYEKDKEIFSGWLYSRFPDIHPFTHDRFSVLLMEGVKKE